MMVDHAEKQIGGTQQMIFAVEQKGEPMSRRYIDAELFKSQMNETLGDPETGDMGKLLNVIIAGCIDDIPTADVVEVVRCKDCKYAQLTYDGDCKFCLKVTDEDDIPMTVYYDGDHYCGFAERREDE